jgi:hypothetical protein
MFGRLKKSWRSWIPESWRDWLERRRLKKVISQIGERFRPRLAAARSEDEERAIDAEWSSETEEFDLYLGQLETKRLVKLANKWEIDIPRDSWTSDRYNTVAYIYHAPQLALRRRIRDARREAMKWWINLLTPVISALTGLAGALIGLLTYLRSLSN